MHHLAYLNGQRHALAALGLEKTALLGFGKPKVPDDVPLEARRLYESGLPAAHRGGTWNKGPTGWSYALPPTAMPQAHDVPAELLAKLHSAEPKPGLLGKNPVRNVLLGGLALGAGGMAAKSLLADPHVEVEPSMPMRTMFP